MVNSMSSDTDSVEITQLDKSGDKKKTVDYNKALEEINKGMKDGDLVILTRADGTEEAIYAKDEKERKKKIAEEKKKQKDEKKKIKKVTKTKPVSGG